MALNKLKDSTSRTIKGNQSAGNMTEGSNGESFYTGTSNNGLNLNNNAGTAGTNHQGYGSQTAQGANGESFYVGNSTNGGKPLGSEANAGNARNEQLQARAAGAYASAGTPTQNNAYVPVPSTIWQPRVDSSVGGTQKPTDETPKPTDETPKPTDDVPRTTDETPRAGGNTGNTQPVTVIQNGQKQTGYVQTPAQEPQTPTRYDKLSAYYDELYGGADSDRAAKLAAYYDELYGQGNGDRAAELAAYYDELYGQGKGNRAAELAAYYDELYGQGNADRYGELAAYYDELYGNRGSDGYYDEVRDYYRGLYDENLSDIERQKGEINDEYAQTNRQLYRDYMNSLKNLPQQLAAQGYTGGLSESSRVRMDTSYGENLGASERSRLQAVAQMEAQEAQARRQYNQYLMELRGQERDETRAAEDQRSAYLLGLKEKEAEAAAAAQDQRNAYMLGLREQDYADQAAAQNQRNAYLMGLKEQDYADRQAAQNQRNAYLLGLQEQDYDAAQSAQAQKNAYLMALREQEYADQLSQAETLAQYTGDFSGYKAMGYSDAEIEALRKSWIAQNPELAQAMGYTKKARSSYSSVPAASTPAEEIAIMRAAGMTDSQIGQAYQTAINNDPELTAAEKAALRNAYKDEMVRGAATGLSAAEQRAEQLRGR